MRHTDRGPYAAASGRQRGFTLLELLVAMSILAVGLLGIVKLQMQSGMGNSSARHLTAAVNLTRSKIEEIRRVKEYCSTERLPPGAFCSSGELLKDNYPSNNGDLSNFAGPVDHVVNIPLTEGGAAGGMYTLKWNVADNAPERNMKTICIQVTWPEGAATKSLVMWTQVACKNLEYYQ